MKFLRVTLGRPAMHRMCFLCYRRLMRSRENTRISLSLLLILFISSANFVEAQQPTKIPQIGYLNTNLSPANIRRSMSEPFRQGLRELGYIEGQNFLLQQRIGSEQNLYDLA